MGKPFCIKHRHKSKAAAEVAIKGLVRREVIDYRTGEPYTDGVLHAYPCRFCKMWHVGHKSEQERTYSMEKQARKV